MCFVGGYDVARCWPDGREVSGLKPEHTLQEHYTIVSARGQLAVYAVGVYKSDSVENLDA